jgi:hypothetical protein
MRIMIAGSTITNSEDYKSKCVDLAKELLKKAKVYEIVIGSDRDATADRKIIDTLIQEDKYVKVTIFYHEQKPKPFDSDENLKKSKIKVSYKKLQGDWHLARIDQIIYSDAVIIIGGSEKTKDIVKICNSLKKLIIPIPCNEDTSASDSYWNEFSNKYRGFNNNLIKIENWETDSPKNILNFAKNNTNRDVFSDIKFSNLIPYVIVVLTSIILWFSIFFQYIEIIDSKLSLIALVILSSFIASNVHITNIIDESKYFNAKDFFLIKPLISILLSVLLVILYLLATFSINGDISILSKLKEDNNFIRIALSLSLLGIIAGFNKEKAMKIIKEKTDDFRLMDDK